MISKEEIADISRKQGLEPYQEEKRYIQTIVLSAISSATTNELVFKDGTSLWFFYGLNRFSEDLDFTKCSDLDVKNMIKKIHDAFEILDIEGEVKQKTTKIGETYLVSAKGPLYSSPLSKCHIKIEISLRNDLVLRPITKTYVPVYPDLRAFSVQTMDPREIAAEKIRAIIKRNQARDVYDLWFLIEKGYTPDPNVVNKKMDYYKEKFDLEQFKQKIADKQSIWKKELDVLVMGHLPSFEECSNVILKKLSKTI